MDLPFHRKVEMSKQDQPKVREARNALHGRILRCPLEILFESGGGRGVQEREKVATEVSFGELKRGVLH